MDKSKSIEIPHSRMSSDSTDDYKTDLGSSSLLKRSRPRKRSCVFKEHVHARHLLSGLERLRQNEQLFDVTIKVQDVEFNCHKCLLATLSPYFNAMFLHDLAENKQKVITINGVDSCAMQHLLDYAYTSETFITEENVQSLLSAANLFAILPVRDACCRYLKRHIDEYNCIGINAFAELHSCEDLRDASKNYILNHFLEVSYEEEFVNLCIDKLLELISDDELNVVNELDVLDAILRWYMFDVSTRGEGLLTLATEVRFPLISPYELEDAIEIFPVTLRDSDAFRSLVDESRRYHLLVNRRNEFTGNRFRPRKCQGVHEAIIFIGGENDKGKPVNTVKGYNFTSGEWKELSKTPVTLTNFRVASSGDDVVYLCGGQIENTPSQCLYKYEFKFNTWTKMNNMEIGRYDHGVCILDDRLYVIGGCASDKDLANCEMYELRTNKWTEMPPLLYPVSNPAVCARFPKIYVFGGENKNKYGFENCVQCFDTVSKVWYELNPMNIPRSLASACLLNDEIFLIGGCALNPTSSNTDRTEIYNLRTNSWRFGPPSYRDMGCSTSVLLNGKIYLIPESCYDAFTSLEYYDPSDKCFKFANIVLEEAVEKARIVRLRVKWNISTES